VRERFRQRHPDDARLGSLLLEEAIALSKAGRAEEALAILSQLDADSTAAAERSRVLYEMAWCQRRLDRADEAAATYERLLAYLDEKGAGTKGAGAAGESGVHFANAVRLELAELEFERKRYEKAKVLLAPLAAATGETLESALYRLCWCHHMLGETAETVTVFRAFEKSFPGGELYPELALLAAKALLARNQPGPAGDLLSAVVTRFPERRNTDLALVSYGECRLEDRRFKEAKAIFQDALTRFPDSGVAYRARFGLGFANENLGLHDEAMSQYREVIATTSTVMAARAQFQIGQCFVATGDHGRAIVEFLKVSASYQYEDWNAKSLLQVAGCFEALEDRGKAEEYYREVAATFGAREEGKLARERLQKLEID
jgi:TolA-binding protein